MRKKILIALCAVSSLASAQVVIQADSAKLQAQIGRDDQGFASCGVRAMVVVSNSDYWEAYDFSAMVRFDIPFGTLKAGKARISAKEALKGRFKMQVVTPPPVKFWFVQENEGRPVAPINTMPADTKGYILEIAPIGDTLRGILSIINGERMQFSIRYKSEPLDKVISFSGDMPDYERNPLMKCIEEVGNRMRKMVTNQ